MDKDILANFKKPSKVSKVHSSDDSKGSEVATNDTAELEASSHEREPIILSLTLDEIENYEDNPRFVEGDKYARTKASIRATGGKSITLNVTMLKDRKMYTTLFGGGSRLKALKELYEETRDQRYYRFNANVFDNPGDLALHSFHLSENTDRSEYLFIERAQGVLSLKDKFEEAEGRKLSDSEFEKLANAKHPGVVIRQQLSLYRLAVSMYRENNTLFESGIGRPKVEALKKAKSQLDAVCKKIGKKDIAGSVFLDTVSKINDPEDIDTDRFMVDSLGSIAKSHSEHSKAELRKIYDQDVLGKTSKASADDPAKIAFNSLPDGFRHSCSYNLNGLHLKKPINVKEAVDSSRVESAYLAAVFSSLAFDSDSTNRQEYLALAEVVWGQNTSASIASIDGQRLIMLMKSVLKLSQNITVDIGE